MAKRVGIAEFEAEVLKEKLPVIVEFYSDSCIPCKQLSPRFKWISVITATVGKSSLPKI